MLAGGFLGQRGGENRAQSIHLALRTFLALFEGGHAQIGFVFQSPWKRGNHGVGGTYTELSCLCRGLITEWSLDAWLCLVVLVLWWEVNEGGLKMGDTEEGAHGFIPCHELAPPDFLDVLYISSGVFVHCQAPPLGVLWGPGMLPCGYRSREIGFYFIYFLILVPGVKPRGS